jgi:CxxC-x17-CxxC domain-containing protein
MNDFRKGGFKPNFKKKSWDKPRGGDRNSFGGDKQMHPATCSGCGKACEVPFRPSAGKEVFCHDCFAKVKGEETFVRNDRNDRGGDRNDFRNRSDDRSFKPAPTVGNMDAVVRQLQVVTAKLDQLITIMNSSNKPAPKQVEAVKEVVAEKSVKASVAPSAKKAVVKKSVKKVSKKK